MKEEKMRGNEEEGKVFPQSKISFRQLSKRSRELSESHISICGDSSIVASIWIRFAW